MVLRRTGAAHSYEPLVKPNDVQVYYSLDKLPDLYDHVHKSLDEKRNVSAYTWIGETYTVEYKDGAVEGTHLKLLPRVLFDNTWRTMRCTEVALRCVFETYWRSLVPLGERRRSPPYRRILKMDMLATVIDCTNADRDDHSQAHALIIPFGDDDFTHAGEGCVAGSTSGSGWTAHYCGTTKKLNAKLQALANQNNPNVKLVIVIHNEPHEITTDDEPRILGADVSSSQKLSIDWSLNKKHVRRESVVDRLNVPDLLSQLQDRIFLFPTTPKL